MTTLLIDDLRTGAVDKTVRNYADGIAALAEQHWDVVYLDHDLGDFSGPDGRELTGYSIACWLEEHPQHMPGRIEIVSSNPTGRGNIMRALAKFYPPWNR